MLKCLIIMKTDLRVIKSRLAIENAFINLVEIKGFSNISIKEIAEKAMVNRNTIYLNYGSKEDILESILKSSVQKYFGQLNSQYFRNMGINKRKIEPGRSDAACFCCRSSLSCRTGRCGSCCRRRAILA